MSCSHPVARTIVVGVHHSGGGGDVAHCRACGTVETDLSRPWARRALEARRKLRIADRAEARARASEPAKNEPEAAMVPVGSRPREATQGVIDLDEYRSRQ